MSLIRRTVSCTASSAYDVSACENLLNQALGWARISYFTPKKPGIDASESVGYKHLQSTSFVWPLSSPPLPQEFSEEADRGW